MPEIEPQSLEWKKGKPKHTGRYFIIEEFAFMRLIDINDYFTEFDAKCRRKKEGFYDYGGNRNEYVIAWAEMPNVEDLDGLDEELV